MKTILKGTVLLLVLLLTACASPAPTLPAEMVASMTERADWYDAQYPGTPEMNVARECVTKPIGLYWHPNGIWAVVCELPELPNTYGAVTMSISYTVLSTEHVSAASVAALEDKVFSAGWEAQ